MGYADKACDDKERKWSKYIDINYYTIINNYSIYK